MTLYEDEIAAAYTLMNQGDMDKALEHVLNAIGHESKKAEAHALASHIYGMLDEPEKALEHSTQAYELSPGDNSIALGHAIFLMEIGDFKEAIQVTDGVLERNNISEAHHIRSNIFLNMGDEKKALEEAHTAYKSGDELEHKLNYALILSETGKIEDSIKILKEMLKIDEKNFDALYLIYRNYLALGDVKNSIKYVKECMEIGDDPEVMSEFATLMEELDDSDLAEKYHLKAAEASGNEEDIMLDMAEFYLSQNRPDHSLAIAEGILKEEQTLEAMLLRGKSLQKMGKLEEAEKVFEETVQNNDDDEAKLDFAMCLYENKKYDMAEKLFEELVNKEFQKDLSETYLDRIWWRKNRKKFNF